MSYDESAVIPYTSEKGRTEKAVLLDVTEWLGSMKITNIWLPLSQIALDKPSKGYFTLPKWLALEKGLIDEDD